LSAALELLTPSAAFAAPIALAPAAAVVVQARRHRGMLATLGLAPPPRRRRLWVAAALGTSCLLLILAAAQPVLKQSPERRVRRDAEVYVVLDTSRSMAARSSRSSPTREQRAKRFAVAFRSRLPQIPSGLASFTDRLLPHLLPSSDLPTFDDTVRQAVGIGRPPPGAGLSVATSYAILSELPAGNAFSPNARRRLIVLLTDGESRTYSPTGVTRALRAQHAALLLVRFWGGDERVFVHDAPVAYVPALSSTAPLAALGAESVGGRVFGAADAAAAASAARRFFGSGPTRRVVGVTATRPLAPWITLVALLPLGLLLARRGGGIGSRRRR